MTKYHTGVDLSTEKMVGLRFVSRISYVVYRQLNPRNPRNPRLLFRAFSVFPKPDFVEGGGPEVDGALAVVFCGVLDRLVGQDAAHAEIVGDDARAGLELV